MGTPICIADAQTLIDHIHKIKTWIYHGHIRLVVPSSTSENVEQLLQKSIEPKTTSQEAPRPKVFGKVARKEYPAFDINPRLASDFLARIQAGKDGEPNALGRQVYGEEERHDAVRFQQSAEQYTPWTANEVIEEKVESPKEAPATWAEALRRTRINGVIDKNKPKGPTKPKLVAKPSGSDNSPWKVQKNAPSISAADVPGALRSMMSCALWHMHESIDRNDTAQFLIVSDQQQINDVARSLNITVRSTKELATSIANRITPKDPLLFGDLERDFAKELNSGHSPTTIKEEGESPESSSRTDVDTPICRTRHIRALNQTLPVLSAQIHNDDSAPVNARGIEVHGLTEASIGLHTSTGASSTAVTPFYQSGIRDVLSGVVQHEVRNSESSELEVAETLADTTPNESSTPSLAEQSKERILEQRKPVALTAPSRIYLDAHSNHVNGSEDSEEETIVFQPKRMSAQKKLKQQTSRPSTADGQSSSALQDQDALQPANPSSLLQFQKAESRQVPQSSNADRQGPKPKAVSPKPPKIVNHSHPMPSLAPTVIDPDAFGRGFAVNTNHNDRGGARSMRARHSPRSSLQNAQLHPLSHDSASRSPGLSPPRRLPRDHSSQSKSISKDLEINGSRFVSNGRSSASDEGGLLQQSAGMPNLPPNVHKDEQIHAQKQQRDHEFVRNKITRPSSSAGFKQSREGSDLSFERPRSTGIQHGPPAISANGATSFQYQMPQQRIARPTLYEPTIDFTQAPRSEDMGPKSKAPEVQYVLKSGSTREAARGKGKLWVG